MATEIKQVTKLSITDIERDIEVKFEPTKEIYEWRRESEIDDSLRSDNKDHFWSAEHLSESMLFWVRINLFGYLVYL